MQLHHLAVLGRRPTSGSAIQPRQPCGSQLQLLPSMRHEASRRTCAPHQLAAEASAALHNSGLLLAADMVPAVQRDTRQWRTPTATLRPSRPPPYTFTTTTGLALHQQCHRVLHTPRRPLRRCLRPSQLTSPASCMSASRWRSTASLAPCGRRSTRPCRAPARRCQLAETQPIRLQAQTVSCRRLPCRRLQLHRQLMRSVSVAVAMMPTHHTHSLASRTLSRACVSSKRPLASGRRRQVAARPCHVVVRHAAARAPTARRCRLPAVPSISVELCLRRLLLQRTRATSRIQRPLQRRRNPQQLSQEGRPWPGCQARWRPS